MIHILLPKRFALLKSFSITYLLLAFIIRLVLYGISFSSIDFSIINTLEIFSIGLIYDLGSLSYIISLYAVYLLFTPSKFQGSKLDKIITKSSYALIIFTLTFSFLAEISFWDEYQRRFNFIAIDYLLYTYEVIQNINESFPLPLIIAVILSLTFTILYITTKKGVYIQSFESKARFRSRIIPAFICFLLVGIFHFNVKNTQAEVFSNINESELAKSGIYSFFAAYRSNELNFNDFYETIPQEQLYPYIKELLVNNNDSSHSNIQSIERYISNSGTEQKPNVIFIGLESMSASYLSRYGNKDNLTPALDSILNHSITFNNIYATGTRTIRGLEAISLCIPPTPGRSIVKRTDHKNLFTIGEVFKQKGYSRTFICGGDGHFDNMANFFGNNGFDIIDRQQSFRDAEEIQTKRTQISDDQITFENAWGACDGDIYNLVLNKADEEAKTGKPFFYLFMTNSNHKPYTYPDNVIDIPSGKSRKGALKYSDKAFEQFFEQAKHKPWFKNTVFVIMADHCSFSAGRNEINIDRQHIPACIYNLNDQAPASINKLASQIDIFPTLFGYLNWSYNTKLFGADISKMTPKDERAFVANYRKLGLLKNNELIVLETPRTHKYYQINPKSNKLTRIKGDSTKIKMAITYYQSAYELYKNNKLSVN